MLNFKVASGVNFGTATKHLKQSFYKNRQQMLPLPLIMLRLSPESVFEFKSMLISYFSNINYYVNWFLSNVNNNIRRRRRCKRQKI